LKLKCDEPLSNVAFNFNLRRYNKAADNGHLNVLQWAREHGCPWNIVKCEETAAEYRHHEVVQWVRAQPEWASWQLHNEQA
jgi:hypothetical protein